MSLVVIVIIGWTTISLGLTTALASLMDCSVLWPVLVSIYCGDCACIFSLLTKVGATLNEPSNHVQRMNYMMTACCLCGSGLGIYAWTLWANGTIGADHAVVDALLEVTFSTSFVIQMIVVSFYVVKALIYALVWSSAWVMVHLICGCGSRQRRQSSHVDHGPPGITIAIEPISLAVTTQQHTSSPLATNLLYRTASALYASFFPNVEPPTFTGFTVRGAVVIDIHSHDQLEGLIVAQSNDCVVCRCDWGVGDTLVQTPCRHVFHFDCLVQWIQSKTATSTCPLCIRPLELHPIC